MSRNEQDRGVPGGIADTGDLGRIWDELERIAGGIDARDAATAARTSEDEAGPDPDADSPDA